MIGDSVISCQTKVKPLQRIRPDWKWGAWDGNRRLDRVLDRQLTFRQKLEWLEEVETLSQRLRANRASHSNDKTPPGS